MAALDVWAGSVVTSSAGATLRQRLSTTFSQRLQSFFLTAGSHPDVSSMDCHFHGDIYLNGDTKSVAVKAVTALHLPARAPRSGTHERFERAALCSQ